MKEVYARISNSSCVGNYACSKFYSGNLTVAEMSCNGTKAVSSHIIIYFLGHIIKSNPSPKSVKSHLEMFPFQANLVAQRRPVQKLLIA